MPHGARIQVRAWLPSLVTGDDPPVLIEVIVGDHRSGERIRVDLSIPQARSLAMALVLGTP
jgi:hypothetical protein